MNARRHAPMKAVTANFLAYAASRVSFSGQQLSTSLMAQSALEQALLAVYFFFEEIHDAASAQQPHLKPSGMIFNSSKRRPNARSGPI